MFNVNEDATSLPTALTSPDYTLGSDKIPAVSASASRDAAGRAPLSLANTDPNKTIAVSCELARPDLEIGFGSRAHGARDQFAQHLRRAKRGGAADIPRRRAGRWKTFG